MSERVGGTQGKRKRGKEERVREEVGGGKREINIKFRSYFTWAVSRRLTLLHLDAHLTSALIS